MSEPRQPQPIRTARDTSAIMRRVRGRDTAPELLLRRALHARGLRYRVCVVSLPGKPDIVFARRRLAVFIDGDYWHGGQWETRGLRQLEQQFARTSDPTYWLRKIRRTMRRDCAATAALLAVGWTVLRFWESDVRGALDRCVEMTSTVLAGGAEANAPSVLADKTVITFPTDGAHTSFDTEVFGWRPLLAHASDTAGTRDTAGTSDTSDPSSATRDDGRGGPAPLATLAVGSCAPGECQRAVDGLRALDPRLPPLTLLDLDPGTLATGADDLARALLALNGLGYTMDAFVLADPRQATGPRGRLFVVGVQSALTHPRVLRERRSAYRTRSETSEVRPDDLIAFIQAHPEIAWSPRDLPAPSLNENVLPSPAGLLVEGRASARVPSRAPALQGREKSPRLVIRERPAPDMAGDATDRAGAWIATNYLDPVVNELLRGQPLYPWRVTADGAATATGR
ncbi:MAG: very short patch repair endonuclease [Ktedonobacterales bacterium]